MFRFQKNGAAAGLVAAALVLPACADESPKQIPAAQFDAPKAQATGTETAVLSGGCFWGMQGVFEHLKGVTQVVSGYSGGAASMAHYELVSTGTTGNAETVKITYDPKPSFLWRNPARLFFRRARSDGVEPPGAG